MFLHHCDLKIIFLDILIKVLYTKFSLLTHNTWQNLFLPHTRYMFWEWILEMDIGKYTFGCPLKTLGHNLPSSMSLGFHHDIQIQRKYRVSKKSVANWDIQSNLFLGLTSKNKNKTCCCFISQVSDNVVIVSSTGCQDLGDGGGEGCQSNMLMLQTVLWLIRQWLGDTTATAIPNSALYSRAWTDPWPCLLNLRPDLDSAKTDPAPDIAGSGSGKTGSRSGFPQI